MRVNVCIDLGENCVVLSDIISREDRITRLTLQRTIGENAKIVANHGVTVTTNTEPGGLVVTFQMRDHISLEKLLLIVKSVQCIFAYCIEYGTMFETLKDPTKYFDHSILTTNSTTIGEIVCYDIYGSLNKNMECVNSSLNFDILRDVIKLSSEEIIKFLDNSYYKHIRVTDWFLDSLKQVQNLLPLLGPGVPVVSSPIVSILYDIMMFTERITTFNKENSKKNIASTAIKTVFELVEQENLLDEEWYKNGIEDLPRMKLQNDVRDETVTTFMYPEFTSSMIDSVRIVIVDKGIERQVSRVIDEVYKLDPFKHNLLFAVGI
jgi:hypothetical protein